MEGKYTPYVDLCYWVYMDLACSPGENCSAELCNRSLDVTQEYWWSFQQFGVSKKDKAVCLNEKKNRLVVIEVKNLSVKIYSNFLRDYFVGLLIVMF